jgi:ribose 5-phosphate isomerase A
MSIDHQLQLKKQAATAAVDFVESGMVVGMGHGSTAIWAVRGIAEHLQSGKLTNILGIPCSVHIEHEAQKLGIPLTTLEDHPRIDLTIDGADEVEPNLEVIKGGGGALLREKIVAQASAREIIVVDESKISPALGTHWPVPVEIVRFGKGATIAFLQEHCKDATLRMTDDGEPFVTDQGNLIMDCNFGPIENPAELAALLKARTGIIEHGLFIGLATDVIVASHYGIRHLQRGST